jgi:hypothetical protein
VFLHPECSTITVLQQRSYVLVKHAKRKFVHICVQHMQGDAQQADCDQGDAQMIGGEI